MTTSPEKWRVADGRRWKALLCCIYTFFIRYPRFFLYTPRRNDDTRHRQNLSRLGFGRKGWGADAFGHSPAFLETIYVSVDGYKAFF
jgi:hypothetical protein